MKKGKESLWIGKERGHQLQPATDNLSAVLDGFQRDSGAEIQISYIERP